MTRVERKARARAEREAMSAFIVYGTFSLIFLALTLAAIIVAASMDASQLGYEAVKYRCLSCVGMLVIGYHLNMARKAYKAYKKI